MKSKLKYLLILAAALCVMFALAVPVSADTSSVKVGGVRLYDGKYLKNGATSATSTKPSSGGYAYFNDGVLTLSNFEYDGSNTGIYSEGALDIYLVGDSDIESDCSGIYCESDLYIYGSGDDSIDITGGSNYAYEDSYDAVHAEGDIWIEDVTMWAAATDDGIDGSYVDIWSSYVYCYSTYGIYANELYIDGSDVFIDSEYNAILATGDVDVYDSTLYVIAYDTDYSDSCAIYAGYLYVESGLTVQAATTYNGKLGLCYKNKLQDYQVIVIGKGMSTPSNVKVNNVASSGKPKVTWNAVSGADCYYVYRATSENGSYSYLGSTTNTHYTNTGATAGKTYYYRVRAVDESYAPNNSNVSSAAYVTCDLAQPKITGSTAASSGKPVISWSAVSGADKYYVYRSNTENGTYSYLGYTSGTSYTNNSANAGYKYYYKVKAVDADNEYANSVLSSRTYVTCDLPQPTNVKVNNVASSGKPKVTWNAVSGADKYYVYRATSSNGTYSYLGTTTNTHYTNTGAVAGTTYYYKVKAVKSSNENANSAQSSKCYITCDLAKPTGVSVALSSSGKPKVSWTAVDGADKYYVYRATSANGTYSYMGSTTNTYYTNTSAKAGTTYYYKVKAVKTSNENGNSVQSSYVSIKSK